MCNLSDFSHLKLDDEHRAILETELEFWHKAYLPIGATVLDVGAGNGETAQFYLNHGAKQIICIEPFSKLLVENFGSDPRITIIKKFINSIKIDCEGGEFDMIVETHRNSYFKKIHTAFEYTVFKEIRIKLSLKTKAIRMWRLIH